MTGPLAAHMAVHILLMNIVAPLAALGLSRVLQNSRAISGRLLGLALESSSVHLVMNGSLFLSALLFWWAVLYFRGERSWQPIAALLVTSKLYCLLAVLFVFAPRTLYPDFASSHLGHGVGGPSTGLADQQLAGLIMLVACPVTYVLAGVMIAARWLLSMEKDGDDPGSRSGAEAWT
ncbi:cytochrome C oxidase assembly protein [Sinorhizobium medicae]|nr:cytochrome C oxidase assembly protein [Sinorhizobium medicae]